jgi:tetratricopeptide (TPR) repeat protein
MRRSQLAAKLVSTTDARERRKLLTPHQNIVDAALARRLKDIAYLAWTTDPTKAQKAARALSSLRDFNAEPEIRALAAWVNAIANITRGKFDAAIRSLDTAASIFKDIGKPHDAAQTHVPKLLALAMPGRYKEASETGRRALRLFEKLGDELSAGKIELNLSNIAARQGDPRTASKYCLSARARFKKLGESGWTAMAENSLANHYADMNEFRKADEFYSSALESAKSAKMFVTEAEIEASMGNLALFRGDYVQALRLLESSRQKYETLAMPHQTAVAQLEIADIYGELNLLDEAFELSARAASKLKRLNLRSEEARARMRLAGSALKLGRTSIARRELKKAADIYSSEKNPVGLASVRIRSAEVALSISDHKRAATEIGHALKTLKRAGRIREKMYAQWLEAETFRRRGDTSKARRLLSSLLSQAAYHKQENVEIAASTSLGDIDLAAGHLRSAENNFAAAVTCVEKLRAPLPFEEARMAFVADKLTPFQRLAELSLRDGRIERAFELIETARSRSLLDAIDAKQSRSMPRDAQTRLNELREELNWFYNRLGGADGDGEQLERETRRREKEIALIEKRFTSTNTSNGPEPYRFDLKKLQQTLGGETVLVEFVERLGALSAFVVIDGSVKYVPDLSKTQDIFDLIQKLQFHFASLRYGAAVEKFGDEMKRRADLILQRLQGSLIAPLADIVGSRSIVIVPVGPLYYLPFGALFDGSKYEIEKRSIQYSPSAAVWLRLKKKKETPSGHPLFLGYSDEDIPLAEMEAVELSEMFSESVALKGGGATFTSFNELSPRASLLHIACHGQFRADNPMFSSLRLSDGWVTVRDVVKQKLRARLVTLSACETGLNEIFTGDEILGLSRGFLSAGAHSLVVSLWTVSDAATAKLMKEFYRNLQSGSSVAESLRAAQISSIRRGEHPYYWSPFIAIGK